LHIEPPAGRKAVFLGDLVDRGPRIPDVLKLVMGMVEAGTALCVPGNHDVKLLRKLRGKKVQITHGLADSLSQLEQEEESFKAKVASFIDDLVSHYVLDDGNLVVAHAGMKETMQGRGSARVRDFAQYGETTGETDEFGLPVRYNWASEYRGKAIVVYGHTPVPEPEWLNRTINIDTGCVFGGKLTALRYPEKEIISVHARHTYCQPAKPFVAADQQTRPRSAQQVNDDLLDIEDVIGKRIISTRLHHAVTIRAEQAVPALEVMSRFAVDPRWLVYLPPTMAPTETSRKDGLLEHPEEVFSYYRHAGVAHVICEEKHMGSRAVMIICRDQESAARRFGVPHGETGIVYTRTGRRFFDDATLERELLGRVHTAMASAGLWDELGGWVIFDCELMPWSAKAQQLLQTQYARTGSAGRASLAMVVDLLKNTHADGRDVRTLLARYEDRQAMVKYYIQSYRQYCWPVSSAEDLKLAPFHVLASEAGLHTKQGPPVAHGDNSITLSAR
jgi:protein phosphatase